MKKAGGSHSDNKKDGQENARQLSPAEQRRQRAFDALSETMISGCVPDMLRNVRAVSSDVLRDGNAVLPYVAFDGLTISGR